MPPISLARWPQNWPSWSTRGRSVYSTSVILAKDADGEIEALEIEDLEEIDELRTAETQLAELLAAEDIIHLAVAMEPGTTAGVLVWENSWAAPFATAARRSGGQLIASGRIPIQAILASLEADEKGD